jgi:hypothetical protein
MHEWLRGDVKIFAVTTLFAVTTPAMETLESPKKLMSRVNARITTAICELCYCFLCLQIIIDVALEEILLVSMRSKH